MGDTIKIIIIDDSASVRQALSEILSSDESIEVIAASADPIIAMNRMQKRWPDVIISDIDMPRKDGITFVREIMANHPTPVVICSALTEENAEISMEAMAAGAVSVISKPRVGTRDFLYESALLLIDTVKSAAKANIKNLGIKSAGLRVEPKFSADLIISPPSNKSIQSEGEKIIAIGASAGGPQAIEFLLQSLPGDVPGMVIVQHMPEKFTRAFADRLNNLCSLSVREAAGNERIETGLALIAPGNHHLLVSKNGSNYHSIIKEGPLVSRHRPSVDVLFRSVAKNAGTNALGIILTGMGDDGASGMLEMRNAGVRTIAQDRATSVVFGMPGEAVKRGGVDSILPIDQIPREIMRFADSQVSRK